MGAPGAGLYADNAVKYTDTYKGPTMATMYSFGANAESTGVAGFSGQVPGTNNQTSVAPGLRTFL